MRRARDGHRIRRAGAAWLLAALCACPAAAHAAPFGGAGTDRPWFSIGVLSGTSKPDAGLADYQWNTAPRAAWGAQALAGRGPVATGLRFWRSETTQDNALPAETLVSKIGWTSLEWVTRARVAAVLGVTVYGSASVGRLHLAYDPDRVTIDTGGSGPVEVEFAPIDEWIAGGGVALTRAVTEDWHAGLEIDHRVFRMDTAHRSGDAIEYRRDTFGDWSARFELAWRYGTR